MVTEHEPSAGRARTALRAPWGPVLTPLFAMIAAAAVIALTAGIDPSALIYPYYYVSFGVSLLAMLAFVFVEIARMAPARVDDPVRKIAGRVRQRLPLLTLPFLAFPTFMIAFTTAKTGIPFLVGYGWEAFWADADAFLFRQDVWKFGRYLPAGGMRLMEQAYVWWGLIVYSATMMVTLYAPPRTVFLFFTATFATWFVGGCLIAYAFSAAGPAFAHIAMLDLQPRFAPFHEYWVASFGEGGPIRLSQQYLEAARFDHVAAKGGGISAMPSMHVGMVALLAIAARRSIWLGPALLFWAIILIASGLTGYHYWVDGLVATAIAAAAWWAASLYYPAAPGPER